MASFYAVPEHGNTNDDFHIIELSARYHISNRFKILFHQPYRINQRETEGIVRGLDGIGDTRILGSYTLLQNKKIGQVTSLFLEIGGGIKLPTGKYEPTIHDQNLPENFNIGNGSWGYLAQTNIVLNYKQSGLMLSANYQHNSPALSNYQFGHQLTTQIAVFNEFQLTKTLKFIPNVGLTSEWITADRYASGNTVTGTGGDGLFTSIGVNIQQNDYLLGASYAHPISENYSHGEVEAKGRFAVQLSYIF